MSFALAVTATQYPGVQLSSTEAEALRPVLGALPHTDPRTGSSRPT